jgi:hypothetical protein
MVLTSARTTDDDAAKAALGTLLVLVPVTFLDLRILYPLALDQDLVAHDGG